MVNRFFTKPNVGTLSAISLAASSSAFASLIPVVPPTDLSTPIGIGSGAPILNWDINGDSANDFSFVFRYYSNTSWQALMGTSPTNNVLGDSSFTPTANYARSYSAGALIASGNPAFSGSGVAAIILGSLYSGSLYGGFARGGNFNQPRFAGFRFDIAGQPHYGFLEMAVNANGTNGTIDFISAAYESDPNVGIQTQSIVPEPTTLAALAAGGLAMLTSRRRKLAVAA